MGWLAKFVLIGALFFGVSCAHKAVVHPIDLGESKLWKYSYARCGIELAIKQSKVFNTNSRFLRVSRLNSFSGELMDVRIFGTKDGLIYEPAIVLAQLESSEYFQYAPLPDTSFWNAWLWVEVKRQNDKPCYFKVRFER